MYASTLEKGVCQAFPDTCKTPTPGGPVPIPYPNIAQCKTASSSTCSSKVMICGMKAFNLKARIPQSQADNGGTAGGGVVSNKIMGQMKYTQGSSSVYIQGAPIVRLTSQTAHNGAPPNAPMGTQIAPSQNKVMVLK